MRKSIYIKLILAYLGVFVLGNSLAFFIASSSNEQELTLTARTQITQFILDNKALYESHKLTAQEISNLYEDGLRHIVFFDNAAEIAKQYDIPMSELNAIGDVPQMFIPANHKDMALYIVKSGNVFMAVMPKPDGLISTARQILLKFILIAYAIGAAVMFVIGWFLVRPVKSLSKAAERIASGDFKVHIAERRKDELGKLIDNFNKMANELNGMEMMRQGFVSDISHEFRTPLTSIEGYAKLLRNCKTDEERNEYIDIITEETGRLATLANSILLLSRIENENITVQKEKFRLDEQVRKMLLTFEPKWQEKQIDLQLNLDNVIYEGDAQLLYQVWSNLFDNAVKFSDPHGVIEIGLHKTEGKVQFAITDYGHGITEEEQKHMFEKFYTGDKSRHMQGNGLGLSIVKRIVDMHRGKIDVQSRKGEYTTIAVTL